MAKDKNKSSNTKSTLSDRALSSRLHHTPIAIVGMASVYADSQTLDQYWDNILDRIDSIIDVPPSRWNIDDYYDADKSAPDKTYCRRGGFIPDIDFNPMEFGLPPNILEVTDVSQLLSLVVAREVLQDAGVGEGSGYDSDKIGITLGCGVGSKLLHSLASRLQYPVLDRVLKSSGVSEGDRSVIVDKFKSAFVPWEENSFPGMLGNVIAGRIANRFDFGGINCTVDAACAGSLAATKLAVSELIEGRSEMMITGGICLDNSPIMYMSFSKTPAFTTNDTIQPFDHNSKGMMVGEGIGMVALKRLSDAERDDDRIYSVIKGVGTSSDGRFKSIYAPRPEGQEKALRRAYEDAGFEPETVGLIEAHGTGTAAGDAAEFNGLKLAFGGEKNHIALGSVKSQVGHTKAAAGTAGMIKASLALHHKILPATINIEKPLPTMGIEDSPFYLNTETRPWMPSADGTPRRAGVSSFGFGGTNFHFVMEEYTPKQEGKFRVNNVPHAVVISAKDSGALKSECEQWLAKVSGEDAKVQQQQLTKNCAIRSIPAGDARVGFATKNVDESKQFLEAAIKNLTAKADADDWTVPTGVYYRKKGIDAKGKVVALFSGQGSQYVNMARSASYNFPPVMNAISEMDKLFAADGKKPLSNLIYPIPVFNKEDVKAQETELQLTQHAQPSIGVVGVGLYKVLQNAGFTADFTAGHSFGELTALWAAGVLNDADYMALAKARGQAMAAKDDPNFDAGTMVAVVGDPEKVAEDIKGIADVSIANYNSKNQVVVAGTTEQVLKAHDDLKSKGYKVVKLPVSAAFHTPLVGHAQKPFAEAIDNAKFSKPNIPVYANGTGKPHSKTPASIKKVMKNHILESVRFKDEVENIYDDGGRIFVEFGPKNVLTKLVENILSDKDVTAIAVNASPKKDGDVQLRQAAVQLAVAGVELNDIDPYEIDRQDLSLIKKSPMNIKLNGAHYVSDKTRKAYEDSLNDGFKVSSAIPAPAAPAPALTAAAPKPAVKVEPAPKPAAVAPAPAPTPAAQPQAVVQQVVDSGSVVDSIDKTLQQFYDHQRETLAVHEKYLESPKQYSETFMNLMQQQVELLGQGVDHVPDSIERSMMKFHEFQSDTLRVHEQYLNSQAGSSNEAMSAIKEQYRALASGAPLSSSVSRAPVARTGAAPSRPAPLVSKPAAKPAVSRPAPVQAAVKTAPAPVAKPAVAPKPAPAVVAPAPVASAPAVDLEKINKVMLTVVAEKTGYPAEMLELSMDMEADLGIDSIKRVEILGSVQDEITELPELNPDDLAELRTLGQIVDYMKEQSSVGATANAAAAPNVAAAPAPVVAAAGSSVDVEKITSTMLSVVAEKTGYPSEMLELSMDMEADLGIDSIKRVEILGAVQDEIPELPELNPDDLAELRTLGQIVDYMNAQAPAASAPVAAVASAAPVAAAGVGVEQVTTTMMSVVAEKTGYPAEMLELSMDMEADLGIDSIKRVEILGAVQDELPSLPELNPDDLAELRTLGQIVDYMNAQAPAASAPVAAVASAAPVAAAAGVGVEQVTTTMMSVVAEKTGYPAEMLELSMDMEADLGIDSIKRVEILGAVQDELPSLPELNPDDLAELRTLGQIVDYMNAQAPAAAVASAAPVAAAATSGLSVEQVTSTMMSVVADKTGYPAEMLELSMDMEADLGIDSIKRVEILGAVQDELPGLPELNPDDLAELRTLGQIVDYMNAQAPAASAPVAAVASAAPVAAASSGLSVEQVNSTMMSVVADKTGYPAEMLELSMDMEADLGIDSIKRVEILGAVQDELPGLPELNPDDLAELRTLGQIVDYMNAQAPAASAPVASAAPVAAAAATSGLSVEQVTSTMMSVVAEKTGYPAEMLELGMDMEADLGIDSIKRVEILGAVQDELPDLPELNPDDLAELRTLGEIVGYMQEKASPQVKLDSGTASTSAAAASTSAPAAGGDIAATIEQLTPTMLQVVADKTGYPVEMLELEMDMEADLGIDSIKRVEILGAVQDSFPQMPEINPDALADLRTLKEIVDAMSDTTGFTSDRAQQVLDTIKADTEHAPSDTVAVKVLSAPDALDIPLADAALALLTDDGSDLTGKVAEALLAKGWQVVVLCFPADIVSERGALPEQVKMVELVDTSEAELQGALDLIGESIGNVDALIHLQPQMNSAAGQIEYPLASKDLLQTVFLLAKHLKVSLCDSAETGSRAAFITVPRLDGCLGYGDVNDADLVQGGLFGLTKTVNLEWPKVFCRAIDIAPSIDSTTAASQILAELYDADSSFPEVGYSNKGRVTLVAAKTDSYSLTPGNSVTKDSVFLVSGGAKGVTTKCVERLAAHYHCKFILLGRSAFDGAEPSWAEGCSDEGELKKRAMQQLIDQGDKPTPVKVQQFIKPVLSNREISDALAAIKKVGGQAEYISADVTDASGMKAKVQPAIAKLGAITGIVHGAGVLADRFIEAKTVADFDAVYSTKIDGMAAMFACVDTGALKHLVLFSSAAGFYGNTGQSDYSVANDILNKTALRFKQQHPGCQALSFNWGPWDGGMVTPELKRMFAQRGVYVIPLDAGAQLFVNELSAADNRCPQILIGNDMGGGEDLTTEVTPGKKPQASRLSRVITVAANPFINDHVIGGNPVVPTVCATGWMASSCEKLFSGFRFSGFDNYKLFKGIVFDGSEAARHWLDITPQEVSTDGVKCQVQIWSENAKGMRMNHYGADIELSRVVPSMPHYGNAVIRDDNVMSGSELYRNGTLFHGPSFQGIDKVLNISEQKLTLQCHVSDVSDSDQGQFPVSATNPFVDDLMYQSMLVWARHIYKSGSLPSSCRKLEQFIVLKAGESFFLSLDVVSHSSSSLIADIILHNDKGDVYARMEAGEVTISESLNKLFESNE